jgi:prepilin-type N-terminal cleavage/methylation domain-containing protein
MKMKKGFTLIELLVVIAVIALLLAVLLPSLTRAKEAGKRAVCLSNTKTLTTAWLLYVQENDGFFPKAQASLDDGWVRLIPGYERKPQEAPLLSQMDSLKNGLLFPYLNTAEVYRCPVAKSEEFRTYSLTHALNGDPVETVSMGGTLLVKINQISNTGNRIVFLDDYIWDYDACWAVYNNQPRWWNTTPIRHGVGGNVFSFADGHSSFWSWKDKRTMDLAKMCYEAKTPEAHQYSESVQPKNEDLIRVQRGVWGKLGYQP